MEQRTAPLRAIDVTGLPEEAVRAVESLVSLLRCNAVNAASPPPSVFDLFGKAPRLRTAEDIARQIGEERNGWGER
jgi:hypothetical protein